MSVTQWLWLVTLSVLWGGSFFFTGVLVEDLSPLTLVLCRVGLAAAVLVPLVYTRGHALPASVEAWIPFVVISILNNVIPFTAMALGQTYISSGLASVMNATTPIWSVLMLHLFTSDDKLTWNKAIGVGLGAVGVAILIGPDAFDGMTTQVTGILLLCITAISYGCSAVWGRRLKGTPPLVTASSQLVGSTAILIPLVLVIETPTSLALPSPATMGAIIGLAVASTAVAYLIFFHVMQVSGPANVMLVTLLIPVSAIALGVVFLNETLLARHIIGALVIGSGLLAIDGRIPVWLGLSRARTAQ
ncbi:MAG: DMT family transporter [Pseudomonadota bacterium]